MLALSAESQVCCYSRTVAAVHFLVAVCAQRTSHKGCIGHKVASVHLATHCTLHVSRACPHLYLVRAPCEHTALDACVTSLQIDECASLNTGYTHLRLDSRQNAHVHSCGRAGKSSKRIRVLCASNAKQAELTCFSDCMWQPQDTARRGRQER